MTTNKLTIIRGDDTDLNVTFMEDGVAKNITGFTVFFTVKEKKSDVDASAKIAKTVTVHTSPTLGKTTISLSKTETAITAKTYYWDLQLKSAGGKITSTQAGEFEVLQDITTRTS